MLKVRAINRELIIGVKLSFECIIQVPRIIAARFQDKHSMIHRWAWKVTEHARFGRRGVCIDVRCEDYAPQTIDGVEFGSP